MKKVEIENEQEFNGRGESEVGGGTNDSIPHTGANKEEKEEFAGEGNSANEEHPAGAKYPTGEEDSADTHSTQEQSQEAAQDKEQEDFRNKYLRLAAEFDNYRKRTLKERMDLTRVAGEEIITGLLPILDDLERAIAMLSENGNNAHSAAIEGTTLIYNKLKDYLNTKGLKEIEAVGLHLDTDYHEAIAQIPAHSKKKRNTIVDVVQKGYTLHGKVVRFSKVVVGQ